MHEMERNALYTVLDEPRLLGITMVMSAPQADVDNMVAAIHQSNAQLGTKKMLSGAIHAVCIIF